MRVRIYDARKISQSTFSRKIEFGGLSSIHKIRKQYEVVLRSTSQDIFDMSALVAEREVCTSDLGMVNDILK